MTLAGLRIAVYARFSTDRQNAASVDDQCARAARYAEERGGRIDPVLVFTDAAISGASMQRPGVRALQAAMDGGRVDVLLVEDQGRISRDGAHALEFMAGADLAGVRVIALDGTVDTAASPIAATVQTAVQAMHGQLTRQMISDKTLRGMEARARSGGVTGGLPYGYRAVAGAGGAGKVPAVDEDRAAIVRRIFAEARAGASCARIAQGLTRDGVPSARGARGWIASAVREMLRNERYAGRWAWGERVFKRSRATGKRGARDRAAPIVAAADRPDLAIVDADTWRAVRERIEATADRFRGRVRAGAPIQRSNAHLFTGLLVCDACGGTIEISGRGTHDAYLRCANVRRGTCTVRSSFRESRAIAALGEALRPILGDPTVLAYMRDAAALLLEEHAATVGADEERLSARESEIRAEGVRLARAIARIGASEILDAEVRAVDAQLGEVRRARAAAAELRRGLDLPDVDELVTAAAAFDRGVCESPGSIRDAIRVGLDGGVLRVTWTPEGARLVGRWDPLALLLAVPLGEPSPLPTSTVGSGGCGGPLRSLPTGAPRAWLELVVAVAA